MANWLATISITIDLPSSISSAEAIGALAHAFNRIPQNAGVEVSLTDKVAGGSMTLPRDERCDLHTFAVTALFPVAISAQRIETAVASFLAVHLAALGLPGNVSVTVQKTDASITTIASPTVEIPLRVLTGVRAFIRPGRVVAEIS